nr:efflux pump fus6 [Quercus suber]
MSGRRRNLEHPAAYMFVGIPDLWDANICVIASRYLTAVCLRGATECTFFLQPHQVFTMATIMEKPQGISDDVQVSGEEPARKTTLEPAEVEAANHRIQVIARELNGSTSESFWASLSFILLVAITQPLYTTFSDAIGRKIPLYIAFTLFAVGSIVFGVAQTMPVVILGRALQGLGGGGLDVLNEVILADMTTLKERPLYVGLMAIPIAAGMITGPIMGASFTEDVNWRWIGWINLPIVGVSAGLAVLFIRLKPVERPLRTRVLQMDFTGMGLFTAGGTAFAVPLSLGGSVDSWSSWKILLPLLLGLVLLVVFAVHVGQASISNVSIPHLPLSISQGYCTNRLLARLVGFSLIAGVLLGYIRQARRQAQFAWVITTLGLGLFALWDGTTSIGETTGFQILAGGGIGMLFTVGPLIMQASVQSADDQGLAVGILVCLRLFGGLIGLAIGSTAFSSVFGQSVAALGALPQNVLVQQNPSEAVSFIPDLQGSDLAFQTRVEVQSAYLDAMRVIWYVLTGFSGLGFLASLCLQDLTMNNEEVGQQHFKDS